jgi:hypothetical protein
MINDTHMKTHNTPLVIFIFSLYVLFMCLVKRIIRPFQHLFIVIGIMCLMIFITYMENIIISYTTHIDKWVFNPYIVTMTHKIMNRLMVIVGNDYNRSNLRRIIERTKRYVIYFLK